MIFSRQDDRNPTMLIKLEQLFLNELNRDKEERVNLLEDHAKTETTTLDCTTPTAKEYRILDVMTCPPSPKKRKASLAVNAPDKITDLKRFFISRELQVTLETN